MLTEFSKLFFDIRMILRGGGEPPVILCIGSDKVTGDALGPVVGHILTNELDVPAFVYGSLSRPVNALNLLETVAFIKFRHPNKKVLVVDSSVGRSEERGKIIVKNEGIYPGAASNKKLPRVGDMAITATVCSSNSALQCVPLGFIFSLARQIASALNSALMGALPMVEGKRKLYS